MTIQSVATAWAEASARRLDWAHRMHQAFLSTLDPRIRSAFVSHAGEAMVVLFGRTQVGKTTLLLQLLGVADEFQERIGKLFRGGRDIGQSSTATAMQYQRSSDGVWRIFIDGEQIELDEAGVFQTLAKVRQSVESGQFVSKEPIRIEIPHHFFDDKHPDHTQVKILDLPGDNPRDRVEAEHVRQIAERYVPHADLILLVGRADDLSFLEPMSFDLPGIRDWRYSPQRFRVITTFSFQLESLREWANARHDQTAAVLRGRLLDQIDTFGITLAPEAKNPELYFPLEFGASWADVHQNDTALYQKMNPVINELLRDLLTVIQESATPHGRIRQAAQCHIVAARVKEAELASMQADLAQLCGQLVKISSEITDLGEAIQCNTMYLESMDSQLTAFCEFVPSVRSRIEQYWKPVEKFSPSQTKASFLKNWDSFVKELRGFVCPVDLDFSISADEPVFLPWPEPGIFTAEIEKSRSRLMARLDSYLLEDYFPSISDAYENDRKFFQRLLREATIACRELLINYFELRIRLEIDEIQRKTGERQCIQTEMKQAMAHFLGNRKRIEQQQSNVESGIRQFECDMDNDIERGKQFTACLLDSFDAELQDRIQHIKQSSTPTDRLIGLMAAIQVCDEKNKLFC